MLPARCKWTLSLAFQQRLGVRSICAQLHFFYNGIYSSICFPFPVNENNSSQQPERSRFQVVFWVLGCRGHRKVHFLGNLCGKKESYLIKTHICLPWSQRVDCKEVLMIISSNDEMTRWETRRQKFLFFLAKISGILEDIEITSQIVAAFVIIAVVGCFVVVFIPPISPYDLMTCLDLGYFLSCFLQHTWSFYGGQMPGLVVALRGTCSVQISQCIRIVVLTVVCCGISESGIRWKWTLRETDRRGSLSSTPAFTPWLQCQTLPLTRAIC